MLEKMYQKRLRGTGRWGCAGLVGLEMVPLTQP